MIIKLWRHGDKDVDIAAFVVRSFSDTSKCLGFFLFSVLAQNGFCFDPKCNTFWAKSAGVLGQNATGMREHSFFLSSVLSYECLF